MTAHPELEVLERIGRNPAGCAYYRPIDGLVRVFDSAGRDLAPGSASPGDRLVLCALGLSADQCSAIGAVLAGPSQGGRTRRRRDARLRAQEALRLVRSFAAEAHRGRARELRAVRRGDAPPGSLAATRVGYVLRLPNGTGWGGTLPLSRDDEGGWSWDPMPGLLTYAAARGLSLDDCRAVSDAGPTLEAALRVLQERRCA